MKENHNISDSELEIMKIIWDNPKITANKIAEELDSSFHWAHTTTKTLINRLLKKGEIGFEKLGKEYNYYPLIDKNNYINIESKSFLKKIFNGSINSMLLNYVKNEKLSEKEIDELKNILNKTTKKENSHDSKI